MVESDITSGEVPSVFTRSDVDLVVTLDSLERLSFDESDFSGNIPS
jgi:hypothetical protein